MLEYIRNKSCNKATRSRSCYSFFHCFCYAVEGMKNIRYYYNKYDQWLAFI